MGRLAEACLRLFSQARWLARYDFRGDGAHTATVVCARSKNPMARIILLDDEANLRRTLGRLLEREGHQVVAGQTFAEIEAHLHPGAFDLLLTDIVMPEFDGMQVLREVVQRRGCQEPVLLVTGLPTLETASEAVRSGAFDYISKPVTKERLLEAVARAVRHVELLRERDRARHKEMDLLKNLAILGQEASLLSHEIKTPITSLRHALAAVADKLGVAERVVVEGLVKNIQRIERLLTHTLSFARPLELDLEDVDLVEVARAALGQLESSTARAGVEVEIEAPASKVVVQADRQLLEEVAVNLLRNALEACGGKGRVLVSVEAEGSSAWLEVHDSGPGVPPARRDEIFRLFQSSKDGGTGIGLAFSRKIAETHHGTLDLADSPGPGACFRMTLPRHAPSGS